MDPSTSSLLPTFNQNIDFMFDKNLFSALNPTAGRWLDEQSSTSNIAAHPHPFMLPPSNRFPSHCIFIPPSNPVGFKESLFLNTKCDADSFKTFQCQNIALQSIQHSSAKNHLSVTDFIHDPNSLLSQIEIPITSSCSSTLKTFPNFEESLLRLPLEIDEDGFSWAEPLAYYKPSQMASCGENKNTHISFCYLNGILNPLEQALSYTKEISKMLNDHKVDLVYNATLGIQRDLIRQSYIRRNFLVPAGQLMIEHILNHFKHSDQPLCLIVHSQGGSILKSILHEIPKEYRDKLYIDTYGSASFIDPTMAARVRNFWHPRDYISKAADQKGWKEAKKNGSLIILEDDGKSWKKAHSLMEGYKKSLEESSERYLEGVLE